MDDDIEIGRVVVHGTLAGGANLLREVVERDPDLSREEKDVRQLAITGGQVAGHLVTELLAAIAQARRD
jgi:hypothetical protein